MATSGATGGEATIERARQEELAEAYGTHAADAVRLAYLLTGDGELARDLVQDAFVRVASRWPSIRDPQRFRAYLRKTVANLAKNHFRRRALERRHLHAAELAPELAPEQTDGAEPRDEVFEALLRLPLRQRTALVLRYYLDLSEREAAEEMGLTLAALKSLSARGIRQLREWSQEGAR